MQVAVEAALSKVAHIAPRSGAPGAIRVFQWNILADGLAFDGFLVRDVLLSDDNADAADSTPPFDQVASELAMARASGAEDLSALKERFTSRRAQRNLAAVVDWRLRFTMFQLHVLVAQADVVALQEVDHMEELQRELGQMGYACAEEGKVHVPVHRAMQGDKRKRNPAAFFQHLKE